MDSVVPVGFKFNPSEEQLVFHFLKRKINGIKEELDVIPETDIYKCEPWDLPDRSFLPKCDKQWYFFSPCDRKYPSGSSTTRATEAGYWKATGRDHRVHSRSTSTGVRRTLVFYKGRPLRGEKTEWLMHEYHLDENECNTGAGLQNAFVLCHVLKKNELPAKIGRLQSAAIEKCDSSPENRNPSCDEGKSEDRSKQLEEVQTNSCLPYMTEDTAQINMLLGLLLDETSSSSLSVGPGEDTTSQQVGSMPNGSESHREFAWLPSNNNDFPQVPVDMSFTGPEATDGYLFGEEMDDYLDEAKLLEDIVHAASQDSQNSNMDHSFSQDSYADILNGDYLELDDFENCDSSLSFESAFNNEGAGIQLRPRSPAFHSYQQEVPSEGTSKRRVRMQLHKMEASAGPNEKYVTTTDIHYASSCLGENQIGSVYDPQIQQLLLDSCGEHRRNLEIITQTENSATGSEMINQRDELSWCQKHEVLDPANFSSVSNSADIPVNHSLASASLQPSEVLNMEPSETIEMPLNAFDTGMKYDTICLNKCLTSFQALSSSNSGISPPVMSITEKIDKSKISEHACLEGCVVESDKLSVVELLHNSLNSVSENPNALPSQAACLGENSTFGGSLPDSGTPSSVLQSGKKSSALNISEGKLPALPNEGSKHSNILLKYFSSIPGSPASAMELPANLKSDKHILGLEGANNSGSLSHSGISDYITAPTLEKMSSKGIVEYSRLDTASSGLRARLVRESNNIVAGGKDKRKEPCEHSAGTSPSSVQPRPLSGLFSQLSKGVSLTGSHGGVVLTCLSGTAFLFLFFLLSSIFCLFASTFSAVAF